MLDLRRLAYFVEIIDRGSISAAARALNVAQPALSHHMRELERLAGVALLRRLPRGIQPTEAGQMLLRHARPILDGVAEAERELRRMAGTEGERRIVHLALIPSLATSLTPTLLDAAARELPTIALHIVEGRTEANHEMIAQGRIDLAVNLADDADHDSRFLLEEPLFLISAPRAASCTRPIDFADLAHERLIMPSPDNPLRRLLDRAARQLGVPLGDILEIDGLNSLKRAVAADMGSSVVSWPSVSHECAAGEIVARRIVNPGLNRHVMLERGRRIDPGTVEAIRGLLIQVLETALRSAPGMAAIP